MIGTLQELILNKRLREELDIHHIKSPTTGEVFNFDDIQDSVEREIQYKNGLFNGN